MYESFLHILLTLRHVKLHTKIRDYRPIANTAVFILDNPAPATDR